MAEVLACAERRVAPLGPTRTLGHSATLSRVNSLGSPTAGLRRAAGHQRTLLAIFSFGHFHRPSCSTSCTASPLDDEEAHRPHKKPNNADWTNMPSQKAAHDGLGFAATATAATVACLQRTCSTTGSSTTEPPARTGLPVPTGRWPYFSYGVGLRLGIAPDRLSRRPRSAEEVPGGLFGTTWGRFASGEMPILAADSGSGGRPSLCRRAGHLIGWVRREAGAFC